MLFDVYEVTGQPAYGHSVGHVIPADLVNQRIYGDWRTQGPQSEISDAHLVEILRGHKPRHAPMIADNDCASATHCLNGRSCCCENEIDLNELLFWIGKGSCTWPAQCCVFKPGYCTRLSNLSDGGGLVKCGGADRALRQFGRPAWNAREIDCIWKHYHMLRIDSLAVDQAITTGFVGRGIDRNLRKMNRRLHPKVKRVAHVNGWHLRKTNECFAARDRMVPVNQVRGFTDLPQVVDDRNATGHNVLSNQTESWGIYDGAMASPQQAQRQIAGNDL